MNRHVTSVELQQLSLKLGGSIWGRPDYFTHKAGRYNTEVYIHKEKWPEYVRVREATQNLIGVEDVGFTPAQCARTIDEWLGFNEGETHPDIVKLLLPYYSFCAATPITLPHAYEHDMSGAYWQIVKAAPTPRIRIYKNLPWSIGSKKMDKEQSAKWQKMLEVIGEHKSARLAVVGNWVGQYSARNWKYSKRWYFVNGEKRSMHTRPSRLSTFGLLIVRLVYELCQEEYLQDNGLYAWVDCVITESPTATYWNALGIDNKIKGAGYFELHRSDIYKIGSRRVGVWFKNCTPPHVALRPRLIAREDYYHRILLPRWSPIPMTLEELPPIKHQVELPPAQLGLKLQVPPPNRPPKQPNWMEQ